MTALDLDALAKLERECTPGPWRPFDEEPLYPHNALRVGVPEGSAGRRYAEDSALIAAARNALPALLRIAREHAELRSALLYLQSESPIGTSNFEPAELLMLAKEFGWTPPAPEGKSE